MASPQPIREAVLKTLPTECWFTGPPYPGYAQIDNLLTSNGFNDVSSAGSGEQVTEINLTPPGKSEIEIAPNPTPGYNKSSTFDVNSSIVLTLGKAPR